MEDNIERMNETVVEVVESGPLIISGNFILKDLKRDSETTPGEVWLCRCGKSADKPFCDGSHKKK